MGAEVAGSGRRVLALLLAATLLALGAPAASAASPPSLPPADWHGLAPVRPGLAEASTPPTGGGTTVHSKGEPDATEQ